MAHINYFFSTLSPYVYLAGTRLEEIAAETGATIAYKPFDIASVFGRTGGTLPKDRHPSRMEYRAQEFAASGEKLGLPLNLKPAHWPTNGAPASYAIIAAAKAGGGDVGKLVHAVCRNVWADNKDIAEDEVIRACLSEAGFDPSLADADLLGSAETYASNLEEAVANGVFGAPFYVTDTGARFWGQDRLDDLNLTLAGKL